MSNLNYDVKSTERTQELFHLFSPCLPPFLLPTQNELVITYEVLTMALSTVLHLKID